MKALSIKEPWASMILDGRKTIETRKWYTPHRGSLLICASATPKVGFHGKACCIVDLIGCRRMTNGDRTGACCDVYPGAFSWQLANVWALPVPFPVSGQLGLFEVPLADLSLLQMAE